MLRKYINTLLVITFLSTSIVVPSKSQAQELLGLPEAGTMIGLSAAYKPAMIKGLTVHRDNPFMFDFLMDVGQDRLAGEALKVEGQKLIKYFMAGLAIPEEDLWVNLSPYEKDRIVPEALSKTDMGRDLLAQDYILKQLTASLIYPEKELGKEFWDRVYAKAQEQFGTTEIPVNTFNKVWIVADRAQVFERNQTVFVTDSHLKVMLDEDYLALSKHEGSQTAVGARGTHPPEGEHNKTSEPLPLRSNNSSSSHAMASQIVREIIIPELEKEVNEGKHFTNLRQIFNTLILAAWYKNNLKDALLNQAYSDHSTVNGIEIADLSIKQKIYKRYLDAFKKGVFNFIKDAKDEAPRKYFSGGITDVYRKPTKTTDPADLSRAMLGVTALVSLNAGMDQSSPAMNAEASYQESIESYVKLTADFSDGGLTDQNIQVAFDEIRLQTELWVRSLNNQGYSYDEAYAKINEKLASIPKANVNDFYADRLNMEIVFAVEKIYSEQKPTVSAMVNRLIQLKEDEQGRIEVLGKGIVDEGSADLDIASTIRMFKSWYVKDMDSAEKVVTPREVYAKRLSNARYEGKVHFLRVNQQSFWLVFLRSKGRAPMVLLGTDQAMVSLEARMRVFRPGGQSADDLDIDLTRRLRGLTKDELVSARIERSSSVDSFRILIAGGNVPQVGVVIAFNAQGDINMIQLEGVRKNDWDQGSQIKLLLTLFVFLFDHIRSSEKPALPKIIMRILDGPESNRQKHRDFFDALERELGQKNKGAVERKSVGGFNYFVIDAAKLNLPASAAMNSANANSSAMTQTQAKEKLFEIIEQTQGKIDRNLVRVFAAATLMSRPKIYLTPKERVKFLTTSPLKMQTLDFIERMLRRISPMTKIEKEARSILRAQMRSQDKLTAYLSALALKSFLLPKVDDNDALSMEAAKIVALNSAAFPELKKTIELALWGVPFLGSGAHQYAQSYNPDLFDQLNQNVSLAMVTWREGTIQEQRVWDGNKTAIFEGTTGVWQSGRENRTTITTRVNGGSYNLFLNFKHLIAKDLKSEDRIIVKDRYVYVLRASANGSRRVGDLVQIYALKDDTSTIPLPYLGDEEIVEGEFNPNFVGDDLDIGTLAMHYGLKVQLGIEFTKLPELLRDSMQAGAVPRLPGEEATFRKTSSRINSGAGLDLIMDARGIYWVAYNERDWDHSIALGRFADYPAGEIYTFFNTLVERRKEQQRLKDYPREWVRTQIIDFIKDKLIVSQQSDVPDDVRILAAEIYRQRIGFQVSYTEFDSLLINGQPDRLKCLAAVNYLVKKGLALERKPQSLWSMYSIDADIVQKILGVSPAMISMNSKLISVVALALGAMFMATKSENEWARDTNVTNKINSPLYRVDEGGPDWARLEIYSGMRDIYVRDFIDQKHQGWNIYTAKGQPPLSLDTRLVERQAYFITSLGQLYPAIWARRVLREKSGKSDNRTSSTTGGIDLNTKKMDLSVQKQGKGVEMTLDPALIERLKREGINRLSPIIYSVTPVVGIWPLMGLESPQNPMSSL